VSIKNIYAGLQSESPFTVGFWIGVVLLIVSLPLALYYLLFGIRKKKILEINALGIQVSDSLLIKWTDILEIHTNDYPAPKMRFYTLQIVYNNPDKKKIRVLFSSDIKPDWNCISETLATYTSYYGIYIS